MKYVLRALVLPVAAVAAGAYVWSRRRRRAAGHSGDEVIGGIGVPAAPAAGPVIGLAALPPGIGPAVDAELAEMIAEDRFLESVLPFDGEAAGGDVATAGGSPAATETEARSADSYLDEGNVYFNVGQYGLAVDRYTRALAIDPALAAGHYNRANAHTRLGNYDDALADYDRALALTPADADALNNRGMLHLYRSETAAALADFDRALALAPDDTTVLVNRGLAHLAGGHAAAALRDFRQAASRDERDAAARYGAGQAAAVLGERDEALRWLESAMKLAPGYAREAAGDPKLASLQGDPEFLRLLREAGGRR